MIVVSWSLWIFFSDYFTVQMKHVVVFHLMNQCKVTYFEPMHKIWIPKCQSQSHTQCESKVYFLRDIISGVVSSKIALLDGQLRFISGLSFQIIVNTSLAPKSLALISSEAEKCITPKLIPLEWGSQIHIPQLMDFTNSIQTSQLLLHQLKVDVTNSKSIYLIQSRTRIHILMQQRRFSILNLES